MGEPIVSVNELEAEYRVPNDGQYKLIKITDGYASKHIRGLLEAVEPNGQVSLSSALTLKFHNDPDVLYAFRQVVDKGVTIRLLLDYNVDWAEKKEAVEWVKYFYASPRAGNLVVKQSKEKLTHWLIVDQKHIRLEEPHPPDPQVTSNAIMYHVDKSTEEPVKLLVLAILQTFEQRWLHSSVIK